MSAIAVAGLREKLAERYPGALPLVYRTGAAVATGIGALDGLLPNGGIPRGRLTVWKPGGGATAVLRAACRAVVERGERAAWVDAAGVMQGDFWPMGPLLVRPPGEQEAMECVEELARCGGFGLVVLGAGGSGDDAGSFPDKMALRLGRAVRAGGGGLVVVRRDTSQAQLRMESHLLPASWEWKQGPFGEPVEPAAARLRVEAWSLGWSGRAEFRLPVLTRGARIAPDPLLVDRRGAPRRFSWKKREREDTASGSTSHRRL